MDNNTLAHWGIKGMRWGVRRSKEQLERARGKTDSEKEKNLTPEEQKARALKSTNAAEIYKARNLLTTQEIKERLDRIDTERRLADVAEKDKDAGLKKIDRALKYVDTANRVYDKFKSPMIKDLTNALTGKTKTYGIDPAKILANPEKYTSQQIEDARKRKQHLNWLRSNP